MPENFNQRTNKEVKEEFNSDLDDLGLLMIRQQCRRTDRPRGNIECEDSEQTSRKRIPRKDAHRNTKSTKNKCNRVIGDLVNAMKPLTKNPLGTLSPPEQSYWFFGKHVIERLNSMRQIDAECASREIMNILDEFTTNINDCDVNMT